jgi:hypothetical protein
MREHSVEGFECAARTPHHCPYQVAYQTGTAAWAECEQRSRLCACQNGAHMDTASNQRTKREVVPRYAALHRTRTDDAQHKAAAGLGADDTGAGRIEQIALDTIPRTMQYLRVRPRAGAGLRPADVRACAIQPMQMRLSRTGAMHAQRERGEDGDGSNGGDRGTHLSPSARICVWCREVRCTGVHI